MNALTWTMLVFSQIALVVGQILLKVGMSRREATGVARRGWGGALALGIGAMTAWFLLWNDLLKVVELSQLMPLEGISPLLIVLGARFFLNERLSPRGWAGATLTCLGVGLVAMS